MGHVARLSLATMFLIAISVLGLVIDSVVPRLIILNLDLGVDSGPFMPVVTAVESTAWAIVPTMMAGVVIWLVYGSIKEERREQARRRIRR